MTGSPIIEGEEAERLADCMEGVMPDSLKSSWEWDWPAVCMKTRWRGVLPRSSHAPVRGEGPLTVDFTPCLIILMASLYCCPDKARWRGEPNFYEMVVKSTSGNLSKYFENSSLFYLRARTSGVELSWSGSFRSSDVYSRVSPSTEMTAFTR